MRYKLRRQGVDLGSFLLEELRQRREAGELTGGEYVQADGMSDWQPLDLVLQQGYRVAPASSLPGPAAGGWPSSVIWGVGALVVILFIVVVSLFASAFRKGYLAAINNNIHPRNVEASRPQALRAASQPVVWTTNTLTAADTAKRGGEFRVRQWLDGYEKRGQRNPACDAEIIRFLETWIARNYGGAAATNNISLEQESAKLAANPNCTDPLVLTVMAVNTTTDSDAILRLERALAGFPQSKHKSYPKFYATVVLSKYMDNDPMRLHTLDMTAVALFKQCFDDGSISATDQQEIAEVFVNGWGAGLFSRNAAATCRITHDAGPAFQWLALTLDGEHEITAAWDARGNGYANTVTEQGWQGFRDHLKSARTALSQAWNLQPDFPLAPCRMMQVTLGDSEDIGEMRTWFDRAVAAQIDYPGAWKEMRWGLRPRWYGDLDSMLAFGRIAINTGRFDTDVPRKFMDSVSDVEEEDDQTTSHHIFGRSDVWPDLQRMYEGYLAAPSQLEHRDGWRSAYAVVAYFAGKYDVSRTQLEALDWKPLPGNLTGWQTDLSFMPLEVAARTGPLGTKISAAEATFNTGDVASALKQYAALDTAGADARTREFIQRRLSTLKFSQALESGGWVDFLPSQNDDPNWVLNRGIIQQSGGGAVEIASAPNGHFLYCRTPLGANFEVKGGFEVVHPFGLNYFQAGLVLGVPDLDNYNWYGFRIRRYEGGEFASIGRGWSSSETFKPVHLNNATNTFDFVFQDGKVTASVNGVEVFHQLAPPKTVTVPDNSFTVGLGAAFSTGRMVIRYRDVQVRKLD